MIELPMAPRAAGAPDLTIDDRPVEVPEGSTILDACAQPGIDTPTLCYGDTLAPANACRICVVELEGARALVPACSRKVEPDMVIHTDSAARAPQPQDGDRVPGLLRRPLDHAGRAQDYLAPLRRAIPSATGRPRRPTPSATASAPATTRRPTARPPPPSTRPTKVDNDLYVRDYSKCILCYKCVDACGEQYQNTFAITVAGRGFDARISTEYANPLPDSACVYCGNCIAVCPTGALMFRSEHELREAGGVGRVAPDRDRHDLPLLRRGLQPHAARPGQPDRQGLLARRPRHHARQPLHQGPLRFPARPGAGGRTPRRRGLKPPSWPQDQGANSNIRRTSADRVVPLMRGA